MGLFDFFKSTPQYSERDIMTKAMSGVAAYQRRNFSQAATLFAEYFDMKGTGRYPELDADDYRMYMNLMMSQFYSHNYNAAIKTCQKILSIQSSSGDAYAFMAMSNFKLNNRLEANSNWEKAKRYGSAITRYYDSISDVKMQGFND